MKKTDLKILWQDRYILAVSKPAGIPVQANLTTNKSLHALVKKKIHGAFAGPLHRLDRSTWGVVLFARTPEAAAVWSKLFREGKIKKVYYAIVEGIMKKNQDKLEHYIEKKRSRALVFSKSKPEAKKAGLYYKVLETKNNRSLVRIELETGRYNQIRAQFAYIRHPIVGDGKYTRSEGITDQIALLAQEISFLHPFTSEVITLHADFPDIWDSFWTV